MRIELSDLGRDFTVEPLNEGNAFRSTAKDRTFTVAPGVFLLRRPGVTDVEWQNTRLAAHVGVREFIVPPAVELAPAVRHEPRSSWVAGQPLPLEFTVASAKDPEEVVLQVRATDAGSPRRIPLKCDRSYHFVGTLIGEQLDAGVLSYTLEVLADGRKLVFPSSDRGARGTWEIRVLSPDAAVALFDAERHQVNPQGDVAYTQKLVPGMTDGHQALRVAVEGFRPQPSCITFRTEVSEELDPWRDVLARRTTLHLRVRATEATTAAVEIVVTERDGTPWGTTVPADDGLARGASALVIASSLCALGRDAGRTRR